MPKLTRLSSLLSATRIACRSRYATVGCKTVAVTLLFLQYAPMPLAQTSLSPLHPGGGTANFPQKRGDPQQYAPGLVKPNNDFQVVQIPKDKPVVAVDAGLFNQLRSKNALTANATETDIARVRKQLKDICPSCDVVPGGTPPPTPCPGGPKS